MSSQNPGTTLRIVDSSETTPAELIKRRRRGGGGGGKRSAFLDAARALVPGGHMVVEVQGPNGETGNNVTMDMFNRRKNSLSASLRGIRTSGESTLGFRVSVIANPDTRTITIYRPPVTDPETPAVA